MGLCFLFGQNINMAMSLVSVLILGSHESEVRKRCLDG